MKKLKYDSQAGAEDGAEPQTVIGGGSIVIHKDQVVNMRSETWDLILRDIL